MAGLTPIIVIFMVILGVVANVVALMIGVGDFTWNTVSPAKQVGFGPALNWGPTAALLMPAAIFFLLLALESVPPLLSDLADRGMLRDAQLKRRSKNSVRLKRLLKGVKWKSIVLAAIIVLCTFGTVAFDFFTVVNDFYVSEIECEKLNDISASGYPLDHKTVERDWSVATCLDSDDKRPPRLSNWLFAMAVYTIYPGICTGVIISGFAFAFILGVEFRRSGLAIHQLTLIPDIRSEDRRRGFQAFETIFTRLAVLSLLSILMLYLMVTQNVYLRTDEHSILAFFLSGLGEVRTFIDNISSAEDYLDYLGAVADSMGFLYSDKYPSSAMQSIVGILLTGVIILSLFCGCFWILNDSARKARNFLRQQINAGAFDPQEELGISRKEAMQRLDDMVFWPVQWISLFLLVILVAVCLVALVAINVGIFLICLALLVATAYVLRELINRFGGGIIKIKTE